MIRLVIAGAYYYNPIQDEILIPHYTGEYQAVDCTSYIRKKEMKETYDESYFRNVKENGDFIEYEGHKYYNAEWGPEHIEKEWELLSDISELKHLEEAFDF